MAQRTKHKSRCHAEICETGSNKCTMRKPRLPPPRSLEITECQPHGPTFSQMDTIKGQL